MRFYWIFWAAWTGASMLSNYQGKHWIWFWAEAVMLVAIAAMEQFGE